MTEEKKMKAYIRAVARRLDLPKTVKARVLNDFTTTIAAMQEAGKSREEITAELGTPQKVAADLNEQMKEFAYRKSPWRFAFLGVAAVAGLRLAYDLALRLIGWYFLHRVTQPEAGSVGIIGGADGPTAVFVTAPDWFWTLPVAAAFVVGLVGWWLLKHRKPKDI